MFYLFVSCSKFDEVFSRFIASQNRGKCAVYARLSADAPNEFVVAYPDSSCRAAAVSLLEACFPDSVSFRFL